MAIVRAEIEEYTGKEILIYPFATELEADNMYDSMAVHLSEFPPPDTHDKDKRYVRLQVYDHEGKRYIRRIHYFPTLKPTNHEKSTRNDRPAERSPKATGARRDAPRKT